MGEEEEVAPPGDGEGLERGVVGVEGGGAGLQREGLADADEDEVGGAVAVALDFFLERVGVGLRH